MANEAAPDVGSAPLGPSNEGGTEGEQASAASAGQTRPADAQSAFTELETGDGLVTRAWLDSLQSLSDFEQVGALHARLRTVPPSEFASLMDELGTNMSSPLSWQTRSMIAARWAEADPEGLRRYIEEQPRNMRWGMLSALYSGWAKRDLGGALAAAQELDRNEQVNALGAIAATLAKESPQKALAILDEHLAFNQSGHWTYRNMFQAWARQDPDAAMAAAQQIEDGQARSAALLGAMANLINDDPHAALEWLDAQSNKDQHMVQARQQVLNQMLRDDLSSVLDYVESQESPLSVKQALEGIHFSQLGWQGDFDEIKSVMDWLGSVARGQTYTREVGEIVRAMAQADPQRTVAFVNGLPPGEARMQAVTAAANSLVQSDVEAAITFVESLEYDDERQRALQNLSWQLAQHHMERAKELIRTTDDPLIQQTLAGSLVRRFSDEDRAEAIIWAEQIVDAEARESVTRQLVSNWAMSDPQAAFDYISNLGEGHDTASLYRNAMMTYMREDPAGAVDWLGALAEDGAFGDHPDRVFQQAANSYVRFDPMAASEWIASLDNGENRDAAVSSLVRQIHESDPEAGFEWASTMDDENKRRQSLDQSIRSWAKIDPAAAYEAIKDARIEASEKERLFKLVAKD